MAEYIGDARDLCDGSTLRMFRWNSDTSTNGPISYYRIEVRYKSFTHMFPMNVCNCTRDNAYKFADNINSLLDIEALIAREASGEDLFSDS